MKKCLFILCAFFCINAYSQTITNYNSRISNNKNPNVVDTKARKIYQKDKQIIFTNYDEDGSDLVLTVDSVVKRENIYTKYEEEWIFCNRKIGKDLIFKYIIKGFGSGNVHLYNTISEIEVYEEIFNSLK
ncbi:hypothetical protein H8S77_15340 [Parabacteroides sp. BX2]|uniref:DUF4348 domain-containing protein n=1 Tax=Parabacteroides segnis TaxID=2763058 RepID=A0ABR7E3A6_9BACT|nr:hypothetical protein [Parabacteroides segnis]MBC5644255.1 hypothetical protein [Parabacteroides segnis]